MLLIFIPLLVTKCQLDEEAFNQQNQIHNIYKEAVLIYLNDFKINASKEQISAIEQITVAIDINSLKKYDLRTTEKLLIADLRTVHGFEGATKTKIIFYLNNNLIVRSNIIVFKDQNNNVNYDKVVVSILDQKVNKEYYSGEVFFLNIFTKLKLSNEYENGILKVNNIVYQGKKDQKNSRSNSNCYYYYLVTTYPSGYQSTRFLYTDCPPPCSGGGGGELYRNASVPCDNTIGGGGGGGSGTGPGINEAPVFPNGPSNDNMFDFTSRDGVFTRYKFNATSNNWDIVFISLPALVIKNVPEASVRISEIEHPRFGEKVLEWDGFLYTFEGNNSWTGVPATDAIIAQVIEDKIDDTNLDPCTKGIMTQLKNAANTDITKVLAKFVPSNIYNVTMKMGITKLNNFAETTKISKNNYLITVTDNSFTTATKLYKATGMLHEMIHAYILSVVDDYNTYSYPTNDPFNGFPKLFNLYALNAGVGNSVIAQHEDMANKYVDAIASALEAYQANNGIPFSPADKQVFEDMAWSGLQGTDVYNAKFPKGSINDNRITARIGAEINGVYSQGQYAIGKPCN